MTPERRARMEQERQQYEVYGEAIKRMRADDRYKNKMLYAYVGGSGKKLNQEIIGTNFIRTIVDCGYRVALERYLTKCPASRVPKKRCKPLSMASPIGKPRNPASKSRW